jgi:AraC family transcriptional regulator, regulatory protein of adaptative response / DNA-3-methyladenine glycosylase II
MLPAADACYAALIAHDRRFDGRMFVGVTSTGIYCRPVCTVRAPKMRNCRFFAHAAAAEAAGFRPCLRCRPELAPGRSPLEAPSHVAWAAASLLETGEVESLPALARRLGVSERHLRRVFREELGVSPVEYRQTQRLLLAKRLLADTDLSVTDVAFAAGFESLRRFNALLRARYTLTPTAMRRLGSHVPRGDDLRFELAYRPPFDWDGWLAFLALRCVRGVESVVDGEYRRSVRLSGAGGVQLGWIAVSHCPERSSVAVRVAPSLLRVLPAVLAAVRRLCDLSCDPEAVSRALGPLAAPSPGLRVPGAVEGFELAVRAVVGQQVTVKAAHTVLARLAAAFGTPLQEPLGDLRLAFPSSERLAATPAAEIASLGIVGQRAAAIVALAESVDSGRLDLSPTAEVGATVAALMELPGVGRWTASYIALRALGWPDAWPSGDVALMKALGTRSAREAEAASQQWSPWRGYAALHLWRRLGDRRDAGRG